MILRASLIAAVLLALNGACALAADAKPDDAWLTNFEDAKARAAKEGKDLLLEFTCSDGSDEAARLRREILRTADFVAEAGKRYVLVAIDLPFDKALREPQLSQNRHLHQEYCIEDYPVVLLADAKGQPYAALGYAAGGAQKWLERADSMRVKKEARDTAFGAAAKAEGADRAKLLDAELSRLFRSGLKGGYGEVWKEIQKLDADNAAGLKAKYEQMELVKTFDRILDDLNEDGDPDAALKELDALLARSPNALMKQQILKLKGQVLLNDKNDRVAALGALKAARAAAPDSPHNAQLTKEIDYIEMRLIKAETDAANAEEDAAEKAAKEKKSGPAPKGAEKSPAPGGE